MLGGDGQEDRDTDDPLAPVTLAVGQEDLLLDRAVRAGGDAARAADADTDVRDLTSGELQPGTLAELTSPSLFAERKVVVVRAAQDLSADTVKDVKAYLAARRGDHPRSAARGGGQGQGPAGRGPQGGRARGGVPEDDEAGRPAGVRAGRVPRGSDVPRPPRRARRWSTPSAATCASWPRRARS